MHDAAQFNRNQSTYTYLFCKMESNFARLCFFLLFMQLFFGVLGWRSHSQIRTGQVTMINSAQTAGLIPISYNISFSNSLTTTTSCGIGVVGYDSLISVYFAFNTTIVNFQPDSIRIAALVFGDTVLTALSLNYIAIGQKVNFTEVQFACFLPTVISTGQGQRFEKRTGTTVFVGYSLQVNVYLSGFSLFNNDGMTNFLSAKVTQAGLTSTLNYVFSTSQNNTISALCYTTVILCKAMTQDFYYNWGQQGYQVITNTTIPSNTPATPYTTIQARYMRSDSMFFGICQFAVSRSIQRTLNVDTKSYNNIGANYLSNYGIFNATLNYFLIAVRGCNISIPEWFNVPTQTCIGACVAPNIATLAGSAQFCQRCNYTCLSCDGAMFDNCTDCNETGYRSPVGSTCPCVTGYIDVGVSQCDPCEYHIPGCSVCLSTQICTLCLASFTLTTSARCQCTSGFLVTGVCTTITGCTKAVQAGASVSCLACNNTLFFNLTSSFNCICMTGFQLNALQNCVPICGDSYLASGQTCDDGNTRNGDGCSNICQIEANWSCTNAAMPSRCFIASAITATVKYIQRIVSSNTALIAVSLSPQFTQYFSMSLVRSISTTMPCVNLSAVYTNNLLMITCPYSSTLEGNTYPLNVSLDSTYFNTSTVTMNLLTNGMNAKLTYDQYPQLNYPLEILVIILDAIALLVLLLSSFTERMIGVEMIQTLQSVLFAIVLMVHTCPSTLESLQKLTYSNGYNGLVSGDPIRTYPLPFSVSQTSIEKEFLLNYNFMLIILCAVILISGILKATLLYQKQQNAKINALDPRADLLLHKTFPSHERINFLFKFTFERVFFLLGLSLMFLTIASTASQLSFSTPQYFVLPSSLNSLVCGASVAITITLVTMVIINGIYPSIRLFPIFMNRFYPPYYVVYVSTFIMLMQFVYSQTYIIYVLLALTITNAVVLAIWRPYPQRIDNFTIIFNQLVIMGALGLFLFQELQPSSASNETIYLVGGILLLTSLFVCVALAIYRIFMFYKYMEINGLTYNDGKVSVPQDSYYELKNVKNTPKNLASEQLGNQKNIFQPTDLKMEDNKHVSSPLKGQLEESRADMNKPMDLNKSYIPEIKLMDEYDTFNAKRGGVKSPGDYSKNQIDPNASTPRPEVAPYDIYGNVKYGHNFFKSKDEEYDALRIIKERLRKDFYRKVHGVDYQPQEENHKQLPDNDQGEEMEEEYGQYDDGI